jgi:hypothetical protein
VSYKHTEVQKNCFNTENKTLPYKKCVELGEISFKTATVSPRQQQGCEGLGSHGLRGGDFVYPWK